MHHVYILLMFLEYILRHINLPFLPPGLKIMADKGFAHRDPLLIPLPRNNIQMSDLMRRYILKSHSYLEIFCADEWVC